MMRIFRHPALHFALLGGLIWLAVQAWEDWQFRVVSMPTAAEIQQLERRWKQRNNQPLDSEVRQALLRHELDQRMLVREALRRQLHTRDTVTLRRLRQDAQFLGLQGSGTELIQGALDMQLYHGDDVIRRRLLERMRSIISADVGTPSDSQLQAFMQNETVENRTRYSFKQLYFRNNPQAPEQAQQRAHKALKQADPAQANHDAFMHGGHFESLDRAAIAERFGPNFAEALQAHPTGQWQGPIASRYGWHLLWLKNVETGSIDTQQQAQRSRLIRLWQEQQQRQKRADYLQKLRQHYRVVTP